MIKLCRVDHRLLHGQVAFSWTNSVSANCILIASDSVVNDEIWKTTLKLGKPAGCKLVIKNIEESIKAINSGITDKYNLLIVVQNIEDANKLSLGCESIKSINLGGIKKEEGYRKITNAIFLGENQIKIIRDLLNRGLEVEIRQIATDSKLFIKDLI